jgi:hypothetical protein
VTKAERTLPGRDLAPDSRWRHPFNILQTNLQEIDAEMDVEAALDAVERAGADTWMLNAGGIVSFYPSELDFQTRNRYLERRPSGDLFGDAVAAAKRRGIKIIARLDMSKVSASIAQQHPEWLFRTADDEPQVYNDLYAVCPSGEYYQARLFDVVDEVLDRYGVDGVFFNWFNFNERSYDGVLFGACHCAACVRSFADFADGAELPTGDMRSEAFMRWRGYTAHVLATLTARITDHVTARGEDIAAVLRDNGPIVYVEANNAYRKMPGNDFWPHATGQAVSAHRTARPDAAVLVNAVAFLDFGFRMGAEQPEHFGEYVVQALARGGNPSLFFFGAPGRVPIQRALALGEEAMRLRQRYGSLYDGMQSAATVALVQPGFGSVTAQASYWELLEEFRGVYESLLEHHIPFDVVPVDALARLLDDERGDRYELVVVPDIRRLGGAAEALDRFVDGGGRVLLTGSSGVDDEGHAQLRTSPVARVESVLDGQDVWSTYVTTKEQPDADRFGYADPLIPVTTRRYRCTWKTDAEQVGHLLPSSPTGTWSATSRPMRAATRERAASSASHGPSAPATATSGRRRPGIT